MIRVQGLSKDFRVHIKEPGLKGSLVAIVHRKHVIKQALRTVDLTVAAGEMVGLIGANGAGKTTLVKILAGIIHPSSGEVTVMGHTPWERSNVLRREMALIMGQKAQLWWDLPALDSYLLLKEIYQIPDALYRQQIEFLADVLSIKDQLRTQVRKLSLGERMKVELMGALLHRPNVVYLDEPTIGLDISAQKAVRAFLKGYQKEFKPIVLLTSHYMEDIKELCPRVVLMKSGGVIYDGALATVQARFGDKKRLVVRLEAGTTATAGPWTLEPQEDGSHALSVERSRLKEAIDHLLLLRPTDLTVQDPPVEEVIEALMTAGGPA